MSSDSQEHMALILVMGMQEAREQGIEDLLGYAMERVGYSRLVIKESPWGIERTHKETDRELLCRFLEQWEKLKS